MTDEIQLDVDRDINQYDRETIGPDELYDLRTEAELLNEIPLAARVEIERMNALADDEYQPKFAHHELLDVGIILGEAKAQRVEQNRMDRAETIESIATAFLSEYDGEGVSDDDAVQIVDEMPTVEEEVTDDEW